MGSLFVERTIIIYCSCYSEFFGIFPRHGGSLTLSVRRNTIERRKRQAHQLVYEERLKKEREEMERNEIERKRE